MPTVASIRAFPATAQRELFDAAGSQHAPIESDLSPNNHPSCQSWLSVSCVLTADPATIDPVAHTAVGATLLKISGSKVAMGGAVYFSARARRKPGTTAAVTAQIYIFSVNAVEVGRLTTCPAAGASGGDAGENFGFISFSSPVEDARFAMNGTNDFTINPSVTFDPSVQLDIEIAGTD